MEVKVSDRVLSLTRVSAYPVKEIESGLESSGIVKRVIQRTRPGSELPDQDDEEGYILVSWGDLSPSMAYLHGPTPGCMSNTHGKKSGSTRESGAETAMNKKPLLRAIRATNMSFEDIIEKYKPSEDE